MDRSFYLKLAADGHRLPIATHLVLHEQADPKAVLHDGVALAGVVSETAHRYATPLAMPLMDLSLEKEALLLSLGVAAEEIEGFHFTELVSAPASIAATPRMLATCRAISEVAKDDSLVALGMAIGPFSLTTKLLSDPITPVFMAGSGLTAEEEPEIGLLEQALQLSMQVIRGYLLAQVEAGAKAIVLCEPAANLVYFSPKQLESNPAIFERLVMEPVAELNRLLAEQGVDLIFHDCGELTNDMVRRFGTLRPAMLSLGSSRKLWEDAPLLPKDTVLYGNLPSKRFYSKQFPVAEVEAQTRELLERMAATGHPFILGSECDVLSVPGSENEILSKVTAFLRCGCGAC